MTRPQRVAINARERLLGQLVYPRCATGVSAAGHLGDPRILTAFIVLVCGTNELPECLSGQRFRGIFDPTRIVNDYTEAEGPGNFDFMTDHRAIPAKRIALAEEDGTAEAR